MKILKKILVVLLGIIALLLIVAVFVPRTYTVTVSETINQPKDKVYDYMRMFGNQKEYNFWVMADPNLNPELSGTDGSVGAIQRWNSKLDDVGEGEQEMVSMTPDRMDIALRFTRPMKGTAATANIFKANSDNQTIVTSEFYGNGDYPFNLLSYTIGRSMIREAQMKSLQNMKRILEAK